MAVMRNSYIGRISPLQGDYSRAVCELFMWPALAWLLWPKAPFVVGAFTCADVVNRFDRNRVVCPCVLCRVVVCRMSADQDDGSDKLKKARAELNADVQ
jgi:hypothetical protein